MVTLLFLVQSFGVRVPVGLPYFIPANSFSRDFLCPDPEFGFDPIFDAVDGFGALAGD